jgi:hypothetical protein
MQAQQRYLVHTNAIERQAVANTEREINQKFQAPLNLSLSIGHHAALLLIAIYTDSNFTLHLNTDVATTKLEISFLLMLAYL